MMNNTTDDVEKEMSQSEYVYVVLTAVTAGLSIFGGTCICVLYFAFKDLRSPARQLLFFLAFSDAFLAFGNLLGIIWYLYSDSAIINKSEGYCEFQSAMTIYFSMTSFSWTVTMGTCLFATVVMNMQSFTATYMKLFHILAWIPPGIITIVALSMDVLGTDTTLQQASWCWIDPRTPNTLLWQFISGKFMEIVAYIATFALYAAIKIFLIRQGKKNIGKVARKSKKDVIAEANRKLTFVPLVFIVCRIWGTLRFLIGNFGHDIVNEPYVTWINPLQGIGDSAQGFANFVLYCFSTQSIRKRMFPWLNKVVPMSIFDSETRVSTTQAGPSRKNQVGPSSYISDRMEESFSVDINNSFLQTGHEQENARKKPLTEQEIVKMTSTIYGASDGLPTKSADKLNISEDNSSEKTHKVTFVVPITSSTSNCSNIIKDAGEEVVIGETNKDSPDVIFIVGDEIPEKTVNAEKNVEESHA